MNADPIKKEYVLGLLAYAMLEFWLGRTKKTRANSAVDLLVVGLAVVAALVKLKLRGNDGKSGNSGS